MKTNTNKFSTSNEERMKKKLKQSEKGFIIKSTQENVRHITNNTHIQLELELAEIFGLNARKVKALVDSHQEKQQLTIASVMQDMERVLEFDHMNEKEKEYVLV